MQAECFVYLSEVDSMLTALLGIDFVEVREVIKDGARRTTAKNNPSTLVSSFTKFSSNSQLFEPVSQTL